MTRNRNFNRTMDILVQAYFNDTLRHSLCSACAVGNILGGHNEWARLFVTLNSTGKLHPYFQMTTGPEQIIVLRGIEPTLVKYANAFADERADWLKGQCLITASGYTVQELARVEYAFEVAEKGESADAWMFNGLMAVLDVLADIHGVDLSAKSSYAGQLAEIHSGK